MKLAMEFGDKIPIGVIYKKEKPTYHQKNKILADGIPLVDKKTDPAVVEKLLKAYI